MSSSHRWPDASSGMTAQLYHRGCIAVIHLRHSGCRSAKQKELSHMRRIQHLLFISLLTVVSGVYGDENSSKLSNAVKSAKVSLGSALRASEREGKPISAKYELEDGKLQLSIYTMKASKFYEVIVDHTTGKIAKTEEITSGDDLAAAK